MIFYFHEIKNKKQQKKQKTTEKTTNKRKKNVKNDLSTNIFHLGRNGDYDWHHERLFHVVEFLQSISLRDLKKKKK